MTDDTILRLADRAWHLERETTAILNIHDFLKLELPPRPLLLDPILPSKGLAMLYGPRGLGKTHVALGIAYAWRAAAPSCGGRRPARAECTTSTARCPPPTRRRGCGAS